MRRKSTVLAITSGKGGVGKSVLAVNLAEQLAERGQHVALIDANFGLGSCAVLLNEKPAACVVDVVRHDAHEADVLHLTNGGYRLIQSVAAPGAAEGREQRIYARLDVLLQTLRTTYDYVLIDTPPGIDGPVRWALDRADLGVMVLAGEPTAIADAYRLCKLIWSADPDYPMAAVVNLEDTEADARSVLDRFGAITEKFTGQVPFYLGWLPFSAAVRRSVIEQFPFARTEGPAREALACLSDNLVSGRLLAPSPVPL